MSVLKLLLLLSQISLSLSYLGWRRRRSSCNAVTGRWSGWSVWGLCTCTDNVAIKTRHRYCTNPESSCGGRECYGESEDITSCLDLAVDGGWSAWEPWSSCQCIVEGETKTRERKCDSPVPSCGGSACVGSSTDTGVCAVDGGWTPWGQWGECQCDHSTGTGRRRRTRSCTNPVPACLGRDCVGESEEFLISCDDQCCQTVNGVWTDWTDWSECECDHSTGTGTRNKTRSCTNPPPSCYGRSCDGESALSEACDDQCCVTVDGNWGAWGAWSDNCFCDHETGEGHFIRKRTCSDPSPSCFGQECVGNSIDVKVCSEQCCKKVDGNWSGWGLWSDTCTCDHSTGTGHLDRNRTCSDPSSDCGGKECEGDSTEFKDCSIDCCLTVDGVWTDWTDWSECECDHSTGTGTRNKTRSCTNPPPSCYGRQCDGSELEVATCNDQCCQTVDGVWTDWTDWSECECDHSSGTGTRNKTRSCTNPPPSCYGRQCEGDETAVEACSDECCRTMNGVWTDWTDWSECECDHSTGTEARNKTRSCTNPPPSCYGSDCIGESVNTSSCNSTCGPCDKDACEKDPTCNLEQCSGDEDGTSSASFVVDECGVDEFDIAGTCLKLYVGGVIIGVAVLLILLATGVIIFRRRKVAKEVPYVVENQNVVNRREFEVVDEGVLTISDRDVRYRANCCHGDSDADGDYQMFTNEHAIGTDENDYITREEKKKRPLSTYISTYSTMENADDPGPSCSSYENQSVTKLESQASQVSSYENHKLPEIPKIGLNLEDENQRNFGGPHYEEMNACSPPSPKVTASQEPGGARKGEHHYAEIRGSIRVDNNTEDTSNQPSNDGGCQDDESDDGLGISGEYIDCDHIYFNPDLDMI